MNQGQIWKYNYGNNTWTNVTPAGVNAAFSGIDVDRNNGNRLVASTIKLSSTAWADQARANIARKTDGNRNVIMAKRTEILRAS